jgi:hypothetical protein
VVVAAGVVGVLVPLGVVVVEVADVLGGAATGGSGDGRSSAKISTATPRSTSPAAPATRGRCVLSHAFTALTSHGQGRFRRAC